MTVPNLEIPLKRWLVNKFVKSNRDIAFISGSRIEGFGNSRSDVDFFLVCYKNSDKPVKAQMAIFGDPYYLYYVDLLVYSFEEIAGLSRQVNSLRLDDLDSIRSVPLTIVDKYYRVAVAEPVFNEEGLRSLQTNFDRTTVAEVFRVWAGVACVAELERARQHFGSGRRDTACFAARAAIEWATDSFLAANGEAFPSRKWRFEKLKRKFGESSPEYTKAWMIKAKGTRDTRKYIEECEKYCVEMGMDEFMRPAPAAEVIMPVHKADARLFPIGEEYYIVQNRLNIYRVTPPGKFIWEFLDGSKSFRNIAEAYRKEYAVSQKTANLHTTSFLEALREHGLISIDQDRRISRPGGPDSLQLGSDAQGERPSVEKLPIGASQFALSRIHAGKVMTYYGATLYDISGGIDAQQFGLVALMGRYGLEIGIGAFLADRGDFSHSTFDQLESLAEAVGASSSIYSEALSLLNENPQTPEEAVAYAERCMFFVDNTLNLASYRETFSIASKGGSTRSRRLFYDLSELIMHLGLPLPRPFEDVEEDWLVHEQFALFA